MESAVEAEVVEATAVATFPPKPDAIMTLLHSDSFLPGVQTLMYSVKKHLSTKITYPPELVVLATPNVSAQTHRQLEAFCTRVIAIDDLDFPDNSIDNKISKQEPLHRSIDNHCPGLTKLRIFELQQYDTILYIDSDCLVLKDVSPLLELNKIYVESENLIAAVPDVMPPDKFNSGVMVVRPNRKIFNNMVGQAGLLATHDGSDTGFLNGYYPNWFQDMPPMARLEVGYNAQQVLHDLTADKATGTSNYWDTSIAPTLSIVHFSNELKPWEQVLDGSNNTAPKCQLVSLWKQWHQKSQNYLARYLKEQFQENQAKEQHLAKMEQQQQARLEAAAAEEEASRQQANHPRQIDKMVRNRYKELRQQGVGVKEAMDQARDELQPEDNRSASEQVAAMFGLL